MMITVYDDECIGISCDGGETVGCTLDDSLDLLEWSVGTRDRSILNNPMLFSVDGELVQVVKV